MAKTSKKSPAAAKPAPEPKKAAPPAPAGKLTKGEVKAMRAEVERFVAAETKKPAPTPAAAKPSKAPAKAKGEAREVIPGDARITVVAKENPRRAGTTAGKTFQLYKTGQTVAEWRERVAAADLDAGYLHADIRRGYIKVG